MIRCKMIKEEKTKNTYALNPENKKELLLWCDDAKIYINISNPKSIRCFAPFYISESWTTPRTPQEELQKHNEDIGK